MLYQGFNYWLTKHGRARFIERVGKVHDVDIILTAIIGKEGFVFIWAPDRAYPTQGRRLVTVLIKKDEVVL